MRLVTLDDVREIFPVVRAAEKEQAGKKGKAKKTISVEIKNLVSVLFFGNHPCITNECPELYQTQETGEAQENSAR